MSESRREEVPGDGVEEESPPGVPLWVKAFVVGAILLIVIFVAMHASGHSMGGH